MGGETLTSGGAAIKTGRERMRGLLGSEAGEPEEGERRDSSAGPSSRASTAVPGRERPSGQGRQVREGSGAERGCPPAGGRAWPWAGGPGGQLQGDTSSSGIWKWEYWEHGEREPDIELIGK